MNRIQFISRNNQHVFIIDYLNCSHAQMLENLKEIKRLIIQHNKPVHVLSIYSDKSYISPEFIKKAIEYTRELVHLIDKQAIVGLNTVKKLILKAYNFALKRNIQSFDSVEEAMNFLLDESSTDKDFKWK